MYEVTAMTTRVLIPFVLSASLAGCAEAALEPPAVRPPLDGEAALALVHRQLDFGPRIPGTPGHAAQLAWMVARLDSLAPEVATDTFHHVTAEGDSLTLVNVMARFRPEEGRRILLLTHWDTRPRANEARDPAQRALPVPGANDGASGTAVLMELARVLAQQAPPMGVDLLFVDGEDYGPGIDDMLLGARRYAETLPDEGRPVYGVLLDMVGDVDPRFPPEALSVEYAPIVVRKVWRAARRMGYGDYFPEVAAGPLTDDHVPLNQAGLPTVDVVDFSYGPDNAWWHTPEDTADKVSAATLKMVGEVMAELIYSGG
jgi:glutaminyl-peptide cyclotransferase